MRALMQFYQAQIPQEILPSLALSAEVDELGISAGLQDRVIQTYEGCMFMDFNKDMIKAKGYGFYERIDAALLPRLYIAYKTELSKVSGAVHNDVRSRFEKGDKLVINTLKKIASLAEEGKKALYDKNMKKFFELINTNFDLRCKIMNISDSNMELINTARNAARHRHSAAQAGRLSGCIPAMRN